MGKGGWWKGEKKEATEILLLQCDKRDNLDRQRSLFVVFPHPLNPVLVCIKMQMKAKFSSQNISVLS